MGLLGKIYQSSAIVPKEKRKKEILNQLVLLPGIPIDLGSRHKDSMDIIERDSSKRDITYALTQLTQMRESLTKNPERKLAAVTNNNLGCAYAKLDSYQRAKEAFNDAIDQAGPASYVRAAAIHNLELVEAIVDYGT